MKTSTKIYIGTAIVCAGIIGLAFRKRYKERMNIVNDTEFQALMQRIDNAKK